MAAPATISIIIPTLNEERAMPELLERLHRMEDGPAEIVVADGGSTDSTVALARRLGARVVEGSRGRGAQQAAGAHAAAGEVLWFLHADTLPAPDALRAIRHAVERPEVVAGHFRLRFTGRSFAARFVQGYQPLLRATGLIYGDSAIFVRRRVLEAIGGYPAVPLFDDLELVKRVRRKGRFVTVPAEVVTSSRRFEGRLGRTLTQWMLLQVGYSVGVGPDRLARWYRHLR